MKHFHISSFVDSLEISLDNRIIFTAPTFGLPRFLHAAEHGDCAVLTEMLDATTEREEADQLIKGADTDG